jgi:16S rRNA G527 N7-methylase RsmG
MLRTYRRLLAAWNRRFNLVSRDADLDALLEDAIVDAAALTRVLPPAGRVADVGAGAGLVALSLSLLRPVRLVLVEPRRRRASFLRRLAGLDWRAQSRGASSGPAGETIPDGPSTFKAGASPGAQSRGASSGLTGDPIPDGSSAGPLCGLDWTVLCARAEELTPGAGHDGPPWTAVYTRAVWKPAAAWRVCRRLLKPGGQLVCLVGPREPLPGADWREASYDGLLPDAGRRSAHRLLIRRLETTGSSTAVPE